MTGTAATRGSAALTPREASRNPLRPILVSGAGLAPDERERRRLALRQELAGRLLVLTPELRDPRNLDNPLALNPAFPWKMPSSDPEFRRHCYALVLEDGVVLRSYSVEFLIRLRWAVKMVRPLMRREHLEVPVFYESRSTKLGGRQYTPITVAGFYLEQSIVLTSLATDPHLLYITLHELAHCTPAGCQLDPRSFGEHGFAFQTRFGEYLHFVLETSTKPAGLENRWLRSFAVEDDYFPPIHPGPERGWQFDRDGHWLMCPHPISDPPNWALED